MNVQALLRPGGVDEASLYSGVVSGEGQDCWLIDETLQAQRAMSCLVEPERGDRVLYVLTGDVAFVLAVLSGTRVEQTTLSTPGRTALSVRSKHLQLLGEQSLQLLSRGEMALRALGALEFTARHCFITVAESLIQLAREHMILARQVSLQADELLRSHGHHQIITAREDVKIDAERISMG